MTKSLTLRAFLTAACLLSLAPMADPCCCVAPRDAHVSFTRQVNLVVWDPVAKIEHFVRNASFATGAADLAFIAPTPTVPEIEKVDPEIFETLDKMRYQAEHPEPVAANASKGAVPSAVAAPPHVEVVQEVDVAGFHAVTLKADDTPALASWLQEHDFPLTEAVRAWTRPYVAKGWYLTTFQVQANHSVAETGLVRLSFRTDAPFNPYFVPKTNQPADSERQGLDLYFVSTAQYSGKIGGNDDWLEPEVVFPSDILQGRLASDFGMAYDALPSKLVVTYYRDKTFPREDADDIFFSPTPEAQRWQRPQPPFSSMGDLPVLILGGLGLFVVLLHSVARFRRRGASTQARLRVEARRVCPCPMSVRVCGSSARACD